MDVILECIIAIGQIYLLLGGGDKIFKSEPFFNLPQWRREYVKHKKGGKTNRGKYYMHEIPKGMSEDTLIMNDVINFEEAFK